MMTFYKGLLHHFFRNFNDTKTNMASLKNCSLNPNMSADVSTDWISLEEMPLYRPATPSSLTTCLKEAMMDDEGEGGVSDKDTEGFLDFETCILDLMTM